MDTPPRELTNVDCVQELFCGKTPRPQAHPESKHRTYGTSQQPRIGRNHGIEPRGPADGKNIKADGDKQDPGGPDKTDGQDKHNPGKMRKRR